MKKYYSLFLKFSTVFFICTAVIISSVYITLNFTPLYKYDIKTLNIENDTKLTELELMRNYKAIIRYTENSSASVLNLPDFNLSNNSKIHFQEVKHIFITLKYLLYICIILGSVLMIYYHRKGYFKLYKYISLSLIAIPIILCIPFFVNFNKSFTIFHKLFFKNDYWEFDPSVDPVINILPEKFFFHCALFILALIVLSSFLFAVIYKRKSKKGIF